MDKDMGVAASPPLCGPSGGAALAAPAKPAAANANTDRELWRSGDGYYSDRVFVTEGGGIGMDAAFGRAIVKSVGEWHYLVTEVERLKAGYATFPRDVAAVLAHMGDGEYVSPAADVSAETGIPEKRVKEIHRALKVLGLAHFGLLCDTDSESYVARGSGYWLSRTGNDLATALHASGIEGEAGDPKGLHPEGESPAPEGGDAHSPSSPNPGSGGDHVD